MPLYRFRILDKFGRTIAGQFLHLRDDNWARRHAADLASHTKNHPVEIWQGDRQLRWQHRPRAGAALMSAEECRLEAEGIREAAGQEAGPTRLMMYKPAER